MSQLISEQELIDWSGYQRRADLIRFCTDNKISFIIGRGQKICTTQKAIDCSLIDETQQNEIIEFEDE